MYPSSPSKRIILIGLVALSISLAVFRERWLILIGDFLIVQDTLKPADVIHVIAGEDYRTDYAFQLYQQGYGKTVFFTGGWCDIHLYEHGARARDKALAQGLSLDAIASDDSAVMSTYMEAERLKEWIASKSSPVQSMAPVPFELTPYQLTWWKDTDSQKYVEEEYFKFIFYLFRYQYSGGFFRDWLSSFDKM